MNDVASNFFADNNILNQSTILYIEDEYNIRVNIAKTLQLICKKVYAVESADLALEIYNNNRIDIILSDINLPGMSGLEFTKIIREENRLIPIILLTAHTNTELLLEATRLRLIDYLTKPIDFEMLHDALKRATKEILLNGTYLVEFENTTYNIHKKLLLNQKTEQEIKLTSSEIELLEYMLQSKERVISSKELKNVLWQDSDLATDSALKNLLNKLRNKIGKESISNISGIGYRLLLK
ncbi:MAG: response regulator transcription factor [Campylobacteraceae bacterium]|nr:response regulator transcription factor [Campylobacteraceae bacterium]